MIINADVFEIAPVDIYIDDDLDWTNEESRVCMEHNDANRYTELVSTDVPGWENYDTVLIGYPIW